MLLPLQQVRVVCCPGLHSKTLMHHLVVPVAAVVTSGLRSYGDLKVGLFEIHGHSFHLIKSLLQAASLQSLSECSLYMHSVLVQRMCAAAHLHEPNQYKCLTSLISDKLATCIWHTSFPSWLAIVHPTGHDLKVLSRLCPGTGTYSVTFAVKTHKILAVPHIISALEMWMSCRMLAKCMTISQAWTLRSTTTHTSCIIPGGTRHIAQRS